MSTQIRTTTRMKRRHGKSVRVQQQLHKAAMAMWRYLQHLLLYSALLTSLHELASAQGAEGSGLLDLYSCRRIHPCTDTKLSCESSMLVLV